MMFTVIGLFVLLIIPQNQPCNQRCELLPVISKKNDFKGLSSTIRNTLSAMALYTIRNYAQIGRASGREGKMPSLECDLCKRKGGITNDNPHLHHLLSKNQKSPPLNRETGLG